MIWDDRRARREILARIANELEGDHDPAGAWARGKRFGHATVIRFVTRDVGSYTEAWTEIDVDLPAAYPLSINLRRHGRFDRSRIKRGSMVDVEVGDCEFDRAFLVEAAPADIVKVLLDEPIRRYLVSHREIELSTEHVDDRPVVRLAVREWLERHPEALAAIDIAASVAGRVRDAHATVEGALDHRAGGPPFRPVPNDEAQRAAAAAREAEVNRVEQLRRDRAARAKLIAAFAFAVTIGLGMLLNW